jgi:hypothetical protein
MRSLIRVWTGLEITCLHYPLPGFATTQERAGGNLRRGRLKAGSEVYHRFDLPVNLLAALGRRFFFGMTPKTGYFRSRRLATIEPNGGSDSQSHP